MPPPPESRLAASRSAVELDLPRAVAEETHGVRVEAEGTQKVLDAVLRNAFAYASGVDAGLIAAVGQHEALDRDRQDVSVRVGPAGRPDGPIRGLFHLAEPNVRKSATC